MNGRWLLREGVAPFAQSVRVNRTSNCGLGGAIDFAGGVT
jgi:hypothetical protein